MCSIRSWRPEAGGQRPLVINDLTKGINFHDLLVMLLFSPSTVGPTDSVLVSHPVGPASIPGGVMKLVSNFKAFFL